jgi:hypothetical protein
VVGYVWRPWGIHIDIVRDRGSKGMDRCPLTGSKEKDRCPLTNAPYNILLGCLFYALTECVTKDFTKSIHPHFIFQKSDSPL